MNQIPPLVVEWQINTSVLDTPTTSSTPRKGGTLRGVVVGYVSDENGHAQAVVWRDNGQLTTVYIDHLKVINRNPSAFDIIKKEREG